MKGHNYGNCRKCGKFHKVNKANLGKMTPQTIKDKIRKTMLGQNTGKRPQWVIERMKGKRGSRSDDFKKKRSEYMLKRNPMSNLKSRKKISEKALKRYDERPEKHLNYLLKQRGHKTRIEILMENALLEKKIKFLRQHRIDRFWVDFYLPDYRIIIECDGDYWHNYPFGTKGDKIKTEILEEKGYIVLRFWGSEIEKNINKCINEVINMMWKIDENKIKNKIIYGGD